MKLNGGETFDAFDYLKSVVVEEVLDYLNRVAAINGAENAEQYGGFFTEIEKELLKLATNRKFLVLNTNVVKENHGRVVRSPTARAFYFELFVSLRTRITLELSDETFKNMLDLVLSGLKKPFITNDGGSSSVVESNDAMRTLVGELKVQSSVDSYLKSNEWYYAVILCNFFAATLLSQFATLRSIDTGKK